MTPGGSLVLQQLFHNLAVVLAQCIIVSVLNVCSKMVYLTDESCGVGCPFL